MSLKDSSIEGVVCLVQEIPLNVDWGEELEVARDHFFPYMLLDKEGLFSIRENHPLWPEIPYSEFAEVYAAYIMGIDPIGYYKEHYLETVRN